MPKDQSNSPAPGSLVEKVSKWLETEGYPLEFRAANVLWRNGFHSRQGVYVQEEDGRPKREIDVLATMTHELRDAGLLRVAMIIECKWSGDKPWVVFTSPTTSLGPAACVSQTISSLLGESIIWMVAGDEQLHDLQIFSTPEEGGFGGRQAFCKGNDLFYSAVQGAIGNCKAYVDEYDLRHKEGAIPRFGVLAFPVVLIEGELIRAYYDADADNVLLEPVPYVRCHWKGSPQWNHFATLDVVSMNAFPIFAERRAQECKLLLDKLAEPFRQILKFNESGNPADLIVTKGSRGVTGLPRLLHRIKESQKVKP
ncbi:MULTISPECIES: hypothetical protein [Rhodopseudomonas]|uniref:Uncharacterized protein n=1 Tax=Rhodopseudomonas palustris TaxID=1076 RepID=A0A0D7EC44_RHOPL|nr:MULTISPECIES: hypothetical protein [Rhodopseudomonas]KIZ38293.1 hypothetical protein OO17_22955 [Rhodopseudomonas palustris]MDF3812382.1 hypothetical protein [Rhodopseudomonas sp. BAL398]WOK20414.1 hypothetical protein RBJ75_13230 [Rhodopseudomonas sp. BAL398]